MSGICGILLHDQKRQINPEFVENMVDGIKIDRKSNSIIKSFGNIVLGVNVFPNKMSALEEITINGNTYALALYGSIYNLDEVHSEKPRRTNPGKILLWNYIKDGIGILEKLRGDFAIAIWDGKENEFFLATDRFQIHPLVYYKDNEKLIFSSRLNGILSCALPINLTINPSAIVDFVGTSIIPAPKTIYKEVAKLCAANLLTCRKGELSVKTYWNIDFLNPKNSNESILAEEFRDLFAESVGKCFEIDMDRKKIGTFLSGGIDSSMLTGVLTEIVGQPIKAFSIGFDVANYDESCYADTAANAFKSELYKYYVNQQDTYNALSILSKVYDEPYGNASAIPAYYCGKMAKETGVNVLYGGDGGDELFAGNERYATQQLFEFYHSIPNVLRKYLLKPAVYSLSERSKLGLFQKAQKFVQRASIPYAERITSYDFFKVHSTLAFLKDELTREIGADYSPYQISAEYFKKAPAKENLDKHLYVDWKLTVADNDLLKFRMLESIGMTIRFPFLDKSLAEFSTRVPAKVKMRGTKLRSFQKKSYRHLLPEKILNKKKHGFGLPIPIWLRTDKRLNEMMHDLVLGPSSLQRGYFRKKALEELIALHQTDTTSFYGTILWNLMVLEIWHQNYLY